MKHHCSSVRIGALVTAIAFACTARAQDVPSEFVV